MSDLERRYEEIPEERFEQERRGYRRRHRHAPEAYPGEDWPPSEHAHYEEESRRHEPVWDRSNWIFLLVLTNFISLALGTHLGHRHWGKVKSWMGQSEHDAQTTYIDGSTLREGR
jgi:hypothetical protein